MKKKLAFILPAVLFLAFLAFKPPAIGSERGDVVVTPTSTFTPSAKPHLRDFDDEGREPHHSIDEEKGEGLRTGKGHHEDGYGDGDEHEDGDMHDDDHDDESDDD